MRIAFAVLKYFPFGGLERDMLRMAESAAKRGHRVVIHTSKWEDDAPLPENIEVRLFPLKNIANHRRMQEFEQKFDQAVKESVFDVKVAFNRIGGLEGANTLWAPSYHSSVVEYAETFEMGVVAPAALPRFSAPGEKGLFPGVLHTCFLYYAASERGFHPQLWNAGGTFSLSAPRHQWKMRPSGECG